MRFCVLVLLFVKEGFFSLFPSYEQEMINKTCFVFSGFKASWHGKKMLLSESFDLAV